MSALRACEDKRWAPALQTAARPEATAGPPGAVDAPSKPPSVSSSALCLVAAPLFSCFLMLRASLPGHPCGAAKGQATTRQGQPPRQDGPEPQLAAATPTCSHRPPVPCDLPRHGASLVPSPLGSPPFPLPPRCTCRCPGTAATGHTLALCGLAGGGSSEGCRPLVGSMSPESVRP